MKDNINYDFTKISLEVKNLKDVSQCIEHDISKELSNEIQQLSKYWQGEPANIFYIKSCELTNDITGIAKEILSEAEEIENMSKHIYLIEQEAKKIARETSE